MPCKSPDFHEKSFRIKHDDEKLLSRLVSRESSKSNSSNSFRVYYADVPSAVPFIWEIRPGTPKHTFPVDVNFNFNIPPLTPPPSYYTNNSSKKHYSRSKLPLHNFLRRIMKLKKESSPDSLSSPSCSSSSHSSFCDPTNYVNRRRRFLSCGSSFEIDHDRYELYCPSSFSSGIGKNKERGFRKAFLSIVGCGSA